MITYSVYIIGPLLWIVVYLAMLAVGMVAWGLDPDSILGAWFLPYISSAMGATVAFLTMRKLNSEISDTRMLLVITTFVLLWVGSALASNIYFQRIELIESVGIAFVMDLVGVFTAWHYFTE